MAGNTVKDMTTNFGKLDKFEGHDFRQWHGSKEVAGPSVNMTEEGKNKNNKQNKGKKRDFKEHGSGSGSNKKPKLEVDAIVWWIDSGVTTHVCKDRCWFKTYEPVEDGYVLYLGDDHFAPVHGKRTVVLEFSFGKSITLFNVLYVPKLRFGYYNNGMFMLNLNKVPDDSDSVYMSSSTVVNSSLWHARLGHVHYKRMLEMSKDELIPAIDEIQIKIDLCDFHATPSLGNKKYVITFIDDASRFCYVYLLHAKDEALDKFRIYKTEVELQQNDLVKTLRTDRGGEYYDPVFFQSVGIIHETTAPYTPQQNGVAERKNRALKEMVNSMLSYSGLSEGFWGEAMLTACYLLNRVPNKRNKTTPYELWYKKRIHNLGIDCIFVGYAEHSKAYRFYVIEPNDSVSINSIIESRDAIFDENRFSSIPRPKDIIPNSVESQRDDHSDDVPIEGSRDQVGSQYSYCYSLREDPRTFNEAIANSRSLCFGWESSDDEIGSIMENYSWLNKKYTRLVIQGFRQKEGIDYFVTYAPVARITTIRLLLALAAIHNIVIYQIDVKTTFLNGDLDEEVYMKQPEGFVMPDNKHKVCKLVKSLYGLKQAPKQWHQKFDDVVLSSGFLLNQSDKCVCSKFDSSGKGRSFGPSSSFLNGDLDEEVYMKQPEGFVMSGNEHKCVYSKFDSSSKGVIICLYVDDMLIFGSDQNQVDKSKKFLSSKFSMKDMGEADVILGIKIKRENKGIVITQSHYIEKILKKFNREDCSPVSTPMDPVEKLKPNTGKPVDQLEYSRAIGCLMYAMTSTRPDIAYAVGRLSRFTSNPKAYSDASWINHVEDSSSTSGWEADIQEKDKNKAKNNKTEYENGKSAFKKQTCITGSTMEYEFVALTVAGIEAQWLRNLIHEIPIWPKPIAPISIRYDSAPTMAKAYS
ncbi:zinc finger, CCHC-type containing protein [Tanacetum coccineum]|uniref:Zinc finger, CCHC-type containing protein n=1 Tax=Tanacetum coccineum TaxID=301880 RepID=A0ABQ5B7L1_9ASTR